MKKKEKTKFAPALAFSHSKANENIQRVVVTVHFANNNKRSELFWNDQLFDVRSTIILGIQFTARRPETHV